MASKPVAKQVAVEPYGRQEPERQPYAIVEVWSEFEPGEVTRYLVLSLAPSASLVELNGAISRYTTDDEEGDGFEFTQEGGVGPLRIAICRSDRNDLSVLFVNLEEYQ